MVHIMVPDQMSTIQQNGHSTLGWVYPRQSWVHIMVKNQISTIQQNGHSTLSWVYPGQSWVHIMVKDQISTIQQNGHSTLGWVPPVLDWVHILVPNQMSSFSWENDSRCCPKKSTNPNHLNHVGWGTPLNQWYIIHEYTNRVQRRSALEDVVKKSKF